MHTKYTPKQSKYVHIHINTYHSWLIIPCLERGGVDNLGPLEF